MATLKFNVSQLSGGVDEAPSHFSGSSDAHCSADSVHFRALLFCIFLISPVKSFVSLVMHTEAPESQFALHVLV